MKYVEYETGNINSQENICFRMENQQKHLKSMKKIKNVQKTT